MKHQYLSDKETFITKKIISLLDKNKHIKYTTLCLFVEFVEIGGNKGRRSFDANQTKSHSVDFKS